MIYKCETFSHKECFQTSQIPIQYIPISTSSDQIRAMQSVRDAVQSVNFTQGYDHIALYSPDYISWASNKVRFFSLKFFQMY